jgi:hypothetical protein
MTGFLPSGRAIGREGTAGNVKQHDVHLRSYFSLSEGTWS